MSKKTSRSTVIVCSVLVIAVLVAVASFRYYSALVDPPLPQPDYALQALISFIGCGLVLLAGGITGVVADKQPAERKRVVITGCLTIMGIGVLTTVAALTIPAI